MFEETFVRFPFVPTVDKQLVNDIPKNLIQKAAVKVRKDIIIGNVQDEGTPITSKSFHNFTLYITSLSFILGSMYIQYNFIKNLTKVPSLTRNEFLDVMNIILGAGSPCHNDFITNYVSFKNRMLNVATSVTSLCYCSIQIGKIQMMALRIFKELWMQLVII